MKMKPEHFEIIKTEIEAVLETHNANGELVKCYENGEFARAEQTKCVQTRFNFDLYFAAAIKPALKTEMYEYLNDDHIATALKKICPKLNLK